MQKSFTKTTGRKRKKVLGTSLNSTGSNNIEREYIKTKKEQPLFKHNSVWSLLKEEIAIDNKEREFIPLEKLEQVYNFVNVLFHFEKTLFFGFWVCLDAFLFIFSSLPIRFIIFLFQLFLSIITFSNRISKHQWYYAIQGIIFIITVSFLVIYCDSSHAYHWIRQQQAIRLYVLFSILEVFLLYFFKIFC